MVGDGRLVDGSIALFNPGYPTATYGLGTAGPGTHIQATALAEATGAIVARTRPPGGLWCSGTGGACTTDNDCPAGETCGGSCTPVGQNWFVNVLGRGLSKLSPHLVQST